MGEQITVGYVIKTSLVSGFTIAAALIWKDVLVEAIDVLFPAEALLYKFVTAIIATILIVLLIFSILKTEYEAEHIIAQMRKMNDSKRKKIIQAVKK